MEESYASGLSDLRIVFNECRLDSRILSPNFRYFENHLKTDQSLLVQSNEHLSAGKF